MCVLALNIINEKIYITLWFWFIILAILTAVYMLYVLSMVTIPSLRKYLVVRKAKNEKKVGLDNIFILLPFQFPCFQDLTYHIIDKADIGDWFLIFLLSRNMDTLMYNAFIEELSEQYKSKSP